LDSVCVEGWDSESAWLHPEELHLFGMAFSFLVELLNTTVRKKQARRLVELNEPVLEDKSMDDYRDEAK
jgi:hypothetical protein